MTRSRRLVEDFLLPSLNDGRYGDLLKWVEPEKLIFLIRWSHKNAAKWSLRDTVVFQDWDRLKGHYHPENKGYYMQAKQRFRAALYKLSSVKRLTCEDKHVKMYQLVLDGGKGNNIIARSKSRMARKDEFLIRPSVICRNTSYIKKSPSSPESPTLPYSPSSLSDSEIYQNIGSEYHYEEECQSTSRSSIDSEETMFEEEKPFVEEKPSVLRENLLACRTSHLPVQAAPVYENVYYKNLRKPPYTESPKLLVVPTYNDTEENVAVQSEKAYFQKVYVTYSEPIALNLSVKTEDSPSR